VAYGKLLLLLFTYTAENPDSGIGFTCYAVMRVIKHSNVFHLAEQWNSSSHSLESIKLHL
jgi:hypothetical protein